MSPAIADVQIRVEGFLTGQMVAALRAVDYDRPRFAEPPRETALEDAARARVAVRHVRGASDAFYLVEAFGDELLMQLQLNVWRFVVIYRVPATDALTADGLRPQLERWQLGAEHAGWTIGWRDMVDVHDPRHRFVETYAYANAAPDLLENDVDQLFWLTDIVQMTRAFMLETHRCGIALSPRQAGIPV
ncbi:MAG TPA: hypothetical protein VFO41_15185 [Alphaproteobacteria bacterium]|nr:hypothetical protein [Alphaproteobacteria bacterium]